MEQRWNEGAAKARLGNIGRILTGGREDLPPHERDETAKGSAAKAASVSIAPAAAAAEEQDDPETAVVTSASISTAIAAAVMSPTAAAAEKQDDPKRVVSASASAAARCRAVTSTSKMNHKILHSQLQLNHSCYFLRKYLYTFSICRMACQNLTNISRNFLLPCKGHFRMRRKCRTMVRIELTIYGLSPL